MNIKIKHSGKFNTRETALNYSYRTTKSTIVAFGLDGFYYVLTGRQYAEARKAELVQDGFIR
jgi:hypothetical protein